MHKHNYSLTLAVAVIVSHFSISFSQADNEYMVEKGDTLYGIGQLLGVPWKEIMKANNLKSEKIFPDQILLIPSAGKSVEQDMYATETQSKPIPQKPILQRKIEPVLVESVQEPEISSLSKASTTKVTFRAKDTPGMAYIPSVQGRSKSRPEPTIPVNYAKSETYIVQAGDSVWSISRKFGVSAWDLRKANNIKYSSIQVGQLLRLPKKSSEVSIAAN